MLTKYLTTKNVKSDSWLNKTNLFCSSDKKSEIKGQIKSKNTIGYGGSTAKMVVGHIYIQGTPKKCTNKTNKNGQLCQACQRSKVVQKGPKWST